MANVLLSLIKIISVPLFFDAGHKVAEKTKSANIQQ